jgi:Bifunctional DNA primase/polymerase, N-terminal
VSGTLDLKGRAAAFVAAARFYSALGWALIPLDGKEPRFRRWETTAPEAPDLAAGKWSEWGRRWNMGVVLGPSGLAVLEYDTEAAKAVLLELLGGDWPAVPTVSSGGRSRHLYFADTGLAPASRDGLELRCGRQQCVVPPSVHPGTGRKYEWVIAP